MPPHVPPYLSTGAAARRLHLARATLLRAMRCGALVPAFHTPGGAFRFRASDIEVYAHQLSHPWSAPTPPVEAC